MQPVLALGGFLPLHACVPGNARSRNHEGTGRAELVAFEGCAVGGHGEEDLVGQEEELEK